VTADMDGNPFSFRQFEMILEEERGEPVRRRNLLLLMAVAPGLPPWGIEIDEKIAAKFPFHETRDGLNGGWSEVRRVDRTEIKQ
jgi:hypothetical protein